MNDATPPKSPLLITAIQLGLLVFAIYYIFIGGQTAQGIYDHTWRAITLWLTAGLTGGWLLARLIGRRNVPRTPFDYPLLYMLIVWTLATIFSVNPTYSRETLVFLVTYLFFFYMAVDLGQRPWLIELAFNAIIASSGLVWTLALLQLSWWYQDYADMPILLQNKIPLDIPRLSVLGNPNLMASFIALVVPIVLYKLTVVGKLLSRLLLTGWLILLSAAILLTRSRGGLLALIIAVGFYAIVWYLHTKAALPMSKTQNIATPKTILDWPRLRWLVGLGALSLLGLFTWLIVNARGLNNGVDVRQQVMAGALKTWAGHPFLGAGLGTLGEELIRHQQPLNVIWADAHNLYLTLTAETGLLGALGLIWLAAAGIIVLWSNLRLADRSQWQLAGLACAAALLGFASHNMVDSLFKFPVIMLLVAVLAGFWLNSQPAPQSDETASAARVWRTPVIVGGLVLVAANTFIGMQSIQNIAAYNEAVRAARYDDWQTTLDQLKLADQLAPGVPFYQRQLGFAAGSLAEQTPSVRQEAIGHYQTALDELGQLAIDHANLGCLLWADNRQAQALQEMTVARQLEPANLIYRLNRGYYLEETGQDEAAWVEYAGVIAARPEYLKSGYWSQTKQRAAALPKMIHLATNEAANLPLLLQLHLNTSNLDAASQALNKARSTPLDPLTGHLELGKQLFALDQLDEARTEFEAAIRLDPKATPAYVYLSRIALTQQDLSAAQQTIEAALFLSQDPEAFWQAARVAAATGADEQAIDYYEAAFLELTAVPGPDQTRYATETARRRPLPEAYLPCLIRIYPTETLVDITQAEGALLEKRGDVARAGQVYQRLLRYEPLIDLIATKLEALCRSHTGECVAGEN
jgi:tetratricopeptide (TPR) repeat protein/O-antigen ligase